MKKKLYTLLLTLGLAGLTLLPASPALAVDVLAPACNGNSGATACQNNQNESSGGNRIYGPNGVLTRVAGLFARLVGIAAVIMIIIGGFKYVTSSGDPNNVKSAKDTVLFAIVGILVALLAQSIVVFVLRRL